MHQFYFGWGSAPDPAEGTYSTPPDPLAEFKGPTSKGREERGGKRVEGKEGKGRRGNAAFHHLLLSNLTTAVGYSNLNSLTVAAYSALKLTSFNDYSHYGASVRRKNFGGVGCR